MEDKKLNKIISDAEHKIGLVRTVKELREDFRVFGLVSERLEYRLRLELQEGDGYEKSGEQKDFIDATNKIEDLYMFAISSLERRLENEII